MLHNVRFKGYGPIPVSVKSNKAHAITCRQTLFGIHEEKTTLVLFERGRDAGKFVRCLRDNGYKLYPMRIETIPVDTVEKVCHMNYFDLFIVYNILTAPGGILHADCYTLRTTGLPQREYLNYQFERFLRGG